MMRARGARSTPRERFSARDRDVAQTLGRIRRRLRIEMRDFMSKVAV
jgi:hypothetical protein